MSGVRRWTGMVVLMVAAACSRGGDETEASPEVATCDAVDGVLPAAFDASTLAGDYTLRLFTTSGDSAGTSVTGTLTLRPHADSLRYLVTGTDSVSTPLYGSTDVTLGSVGALTQGNLGSADPMMPGAAVQQTSVDRGTEVVIRLGSQLNRRGRALFDGASTALFVRWASDGRFGGSWRSSLTTSVAGGHFCADGR